MRAGVGIALLPIAGLASPPQGTVARRVRGVDLSLAVGLVRANAGEPYSVLTSEVTAAIRRAAPVWRDRASRQSGERMAGGSGVV